MQFSFTSDQLEFAAGLREMLDRELTAARLRDVWDDGTGHDAKLWDRLVEMGVLAMLLPEADGGLGGDYVDAVLLVEELGRAAVPGPAMETMSLGAIALAGTQFAGGVADGSTPVTAALLGERYVPHSTSVGVLLAAVDREVRAVERPV